eukprot:TRINITY_DN1792_c0_g1_i14.p1 TRINITY_DN1792_c0_g1~~TRINITY_DN1792_c0_g1_i14.p1  ORF type:complete len:164 (+),score=25.06 TRINITY_DN1792_c0_g1_i14:65-556(+)
MRPLQHKNIKQRKIMGTQCTSVNIDSSGYSNQEGTELPTRSVDELSNAILSTMRVELKFRCEGLPFIKREKTVVSYRVECGGSQHVLKWLEKIEKDAQPKSSNAYILPYEMGTNKLMRIFVYRHEDEAKILFGEAAIDLDLSLIHICRCRRYAVCRSRWSPYH